MQKQQYENLIKDNLYKEEIMPLFDFFEKYCDGQIGINDVNENYIYQDMLDAGIYEKSLYLAKKIRDNKLIYLKPYVDSLCRNQSQFIKGKSNLRTKNKVKKILWSYLSISRAIIDVVSISDAINNGNINGEKVILAVGLVNIEDDNIHVNDEIESMISVTSGTNYKVLPIHGCSTNVFEAVLKLYNFDVVHMSGHCDKGKNGKWSIQFVDSRMLHSTLAGKLTSATDLVFLNCCNTYQYVKGEAFANSSNTIVHKDPVWGTDAMNVSTEFYRHLSNGNDVVNSWNNAKNQEYPCKYILI